MAAATALALLFHLVGGAAPPLAADREQPRLALPDLDGQLQSLEQLRGRPVVINFWATWCTPCREELPMLARVHRDYTDVGVAFIGVSVDRESARSAIVALVEQSGVRYPIWLGADLTDMERFGLGAVIPATAILRSDGTIAKRFSGTVAEADLRRNLDRLVDANGPPREHQRKRRDLPGGQIAASASPAVDG